MLILSDIAELSIVYLSEEKNININIAEGDSFILRCRVWYSSNLETGRWAPELRWYNHNNELISSSTFYDNSNLVRLDSNPVTATLAIHGKNFRCHTAYGAAQGSVGIETPNHKFSKIPPTYAKKQTIMINVDRKSLSLFVTWLNESKCYNTLVLFLCIIYVYIM